VTGDEFTARRVDKAIRAIPHWTTGVLAESPNRDEVLEALVALEEILLQLAGDDPDSPEQYMADGLALFAAVLTGPGTMRWMMAVESLGGGDVTTWLSRWSQELEQTPSGLAMLAKLFPE
jgi:hypothetical protein